MIILVNGERTRQLFHIVVFVLSTLFPRPFSKKKIVVFSHIYFFPLKYLKIIRAKLYHDLELKFNLRDAERTAAGEEKHSKNWIMNVYFIYLAPIKLGDSFDCVAVGEVR